VVDESRDENTSSAAPVVASGDQTESGEKTTYDQEKPTTTVD